ncbi:MAG TPA: PQQ-dependent sugar dehydrogenase [Verrucomicrobiales bacterium]|nr:PQQ-dependent sugar dehydrogenase [Verrucomicrobiales bacterium]
MEKRGLNRWTRGIGQGCCFAATLIFGTEALAQERVEWTTSRVAGTPDPPSPYLTQRIFPRLNFREPVELLSAPGSDRIYVVEVNGKIFSFPPGPDPAEAALLVDLREAIPRFQQIYGMAFHPRYPEVPQLFLCYVLKGEDPDGTRVSRFRVRPGEPPELLVSSEEILLTFLGGGHNGGCLRFGPDGYLYIATGDGAGPNPPDPLRTGQDCSDLLSSLLRIDVERQEEGKLYATPPDNPFAGRPGIRPEIWAFGFRNPWKFSFDPETGLVWVGDVGWDLWELVYLAEPGGNYGWSIMEGSQPVLTELEPGPSPIRPPVMQHPHSEATSITGGYVYRGQRLSALKGAYVYGDYGSGKIWALRMKGREMASVEEIADTAHAIICFGESPDGDLYVVDYGGGVYRLAPNPDEGFAKVFPRRLSESGLFVSTPQANPAAGVRRYEIGATMWEDGASSERFVGIPGRPTIGTGGGNWTFPEGAVLTKTLFFESGETRFRVETQMLHRHQGEWRAYSYRWRPDQSDADLVRAQGEEGHFSVPAEDGGSREVTWSFQSRSDCLRCHHIHRPVIAFSAPFLDLPGGSAGGQGQLAGLTGAGLLEPGFIEAPGERIPDPWDESQALADRARAYLHVNCAHCHQQNGGGMTPLDLPWQVGLEHTAAYDTIPTQGHFGIGDARIVAPGAPERSVLYYRMAKLGHSRMPRIGSREVDWAGLDLVRRWILDLGKREEEPPEIPLTRASDRGDWLRDPVRALAVQRHVQGLPVDTPLRRRLVEQALMEGAPSVRDLFVPLLPAADRAPYEAQEPRPEEVLALRGDADRGARLVLEGRAAACLACHRCAGKGTSLGPDFEDLGSRLGPEELLEATLDPSRSIAEGYDGWLLETRDGVARTGLVLERGSGTLRFRDGTGDQAFAEIEVARLEPWPQSLMPEKLLLGMSAQEAADLIAYLQSLRPAQKDGG